MRGNSNLKRPRYYFICGTMGNRKVGFLSALPLDVHAVGDKGVDWTLEAFYKAAGGDLKARNRRHRIEHFPFRKLESIQRAGAMGVPVCVQPTCIIVRAEDFVQRRSLCLGDGLRWKPWFRRKPF